MPYSHVLLAVITAAATVSDLVRYRIPNRFFLFCLGVKLSLAVLMGEAPDPAGILRNAFFPFLLLYVPGCFRVIGAGDIKLFCVISVFLGREAVFKIILVSFLAGGAEALFLMLRRGNLAERIRYFLAYVKRTLEEKRLLPYMEEKDGDAIFHFTVPILAAVLLYLGGVYR